MIFNQLKFTQPVSENYDFIPIDAMIQMESAQQTMTYLFENLNMGDPKTEIILENAFTDIINKIIEFFKKLFAKIKDFFRGKRKDDKATDAKIKENNNKIDTLINDDDKQLWKKPDGVLGDIMTTYQNDSKKLQIVNMASMVPNAVSQAGGLIEKTINALANDFKKNLSNVGDGDLNNKLNIEKYAGIDANKIWSIADIKLNKNSSPSMYVSHLHTMEDIKKSINEMCEDLNSILNITEKESTNISQIQNIIDRTVKIVGRIKGKHREVVTSEAMKFKTYCQSLISEYVKFLNKVESYARNDKELVLAMYDKALGSYNGAVSKK